MNSQENFLFDLQGYMTVPNALSADQLAALNAIFDQKVALEAGAELSTKRWGNVLSWGQPYKDLLDPATVMPYLDELLGPNCRLDHDYADLIRVGKGPIGTRLHGGATPFDPAQYYAARDGKMYNGLMVVAYNLKDVNPGDGGFGCVPGSHKSAFPFPHEWAELDQLQPFMRAVTGPAGTAIIFTEALTHGTLPWHGAGERRTIFMKYSPHPLSWSARYYTAADYEPLTERQRALLEAPNARYRGR